MVMSIFIGKCVMDILSFLLWLDYIKFPHDAIRLSTSSYYNKVLWTQTLLAQQNKLGESSLQFSLFSSSIDEITFEIFMSWSKFMISKQVYLVQFRVESTSSSICTTHARTHEHIYICFNFEGVLSLSHVPHCSTLMHLR
jgi:hypothetical protein